MMKNRKKICQLAGILLTLALLVTGIPAQAAGGSAERQPVDYSQLGDWPAGPDIVGEGGYLIELNSGAVLYEKNADETLYPASITKILTALIVIENCSLDEMVTFSYDAVHDLEEGGYSYIADTGDQLSVEECLYALLLQSSNEAAYALAEHCGGTVAGFAEMMNARAKELGATHSHFANPHGLYNEDHYTTCHDMAMIMWAAVQNETFLKIDSTFSYRTAVTSTQPEGFYCQMRHAMMNSNSEYFNSAVVAGKTGYIQMAKNTLVTYAVKDNMELVSVVMRSEANGQIYKDTQALLDYGFDNFAMQPISQTADLAAMEQQVASVTDRVVQNIEISADAQALLPNSMTDIPFETQFVIDENSLNGDAMSGQLTYSWNGITLGWDLVTVRLVPQTGLFASGASSDESAAEEPELIANEPENGGIPSGIKILLIVILVVLLLVVLLQIISLIQRSRRRRRRRKKRKLKMKR